MVRLPYHLLAWLVELEASVLVRLPYHLLAWLVELEASALAPRPYQLPVWLVEVEASVLVRLPYQLPVGLRAPAPLCPPCPPPVLLAVEWPPHLPGYLEALWD